MMKKTGFILIGSLLLLACQQDVLKPGFEEDYGEGSYEVIKKSKKVSQFKLDPFNQDTVEVSRIGDYAVVGTDQKVSKRNKNGLKSLMTNPSNYNTDGLNWACVFNPTYGFKFKRKKQEAYLLVSPSCDKAKFWIKGEKEVYFIDYSLLVTEIDSIFNARK